MKTHESLHHLDTSPSATFAAELRNAKYQAITEDGKSGEVYAGGHFEAHPYKGLREGVSGHGVFFGELRGIGHAGSVAVKAHGTMEDVRNEIEGGQILKRLGFSSYEPIGAVAGEEHAYLITAFNPGLVALNEMDWQPVADGLDAETLEQQESWIKGSAEALARLHGEGKAAHGDAQIKNFALDRNSPGVHLIDPEKVIIVEDPVELADKAADDLLALRDSLVRVSHQEGGRFYHGVGAWDRLSPEMIHTWTDRRIIQPYIEKISEIADDSSIDDVFLDTLVERINDRLVS